MRAAAAAALALSSALAQKCQTPAPPPAASYSLAKFWGSWFEIARIQTEGGNLIQQFCACTNIIYTPHNASAGAAGNVSDTDVNNSCRFETAKGAWLNATSYLTQGGAAGGHWSEAYFPGGPEASYNVIVAGTDARGVDYFVEYDCSIGVLGQPNYCLHFLSREPLGFDAALLAQLVQQTTGAMGLNPEKRVLNMTMQDEGAGAAGRQAEGGGGAAAPEHAPATDPHPAPPPPRPAIGDPSRIDSPPSAGGSHATVSSP